MYTTEELKKLPAVDKTTGDIYKIIDFVFDSGRLEGLILETDNSQYFAKEILKVGQDAVMIRNCQTKEPNRQTLPFGHYVFRPDGVMLGKITDVLIDKNFNLRAYILDGGLMIDYKENQNVLTKLKDAKSAKTKVDGAPKKQSKPKTTSSPKKTTQTSTKAKTSSTKSAAPKEKKSSNKKVQPKNIKPAAVKDDISERNLIIEPQSPTLTKAQPTTEQNSAVEPKVSALTMADDISQPTSIIEPETSTLSRAEETTKKNITVEPEIPALTLADEISPNLTFEPDTPTLTQEDEISEQNITIEPQIPVLTQEDENAASQADDSEIEQAKENIINIEAILSGVLKEPEDIKAQLINLFSSKDFIQKIEEEGIFFIENDAKITEQINNIIDAQNSKEECLFETNAEDIAVQKISDEFQERLSRVIQKDKDISQKAYQKENTPPQKKADKNILPYRILADYKFLIGRLLTDDIYDADGQILASKNEMITAKCVLKAHEAGLLLELTKNSRL